MENKTKVKQDSVEKGESVESLESEIDNIVLKNCTRSPYWHSEQLLKLFQSRERDLKTEIERLKKRLGDNDISDNEAEAMDNSD